MTWRCFCCISGEEQPESRYALLDYFDLCNCQIIKLFFFNKFLIFSTSFFSFFSVCKNRDYPWEIYSLKELLQATNNFHQDNKIGEGGFGSVYWGRTSKGVEAIMSISFS
jgi:hypothetical protein